MCMSSTDFVLGGFSISSRLVTTPENAPLQSPKSHRAQIPPVLGAERKSHRRTLLQGAGALTKAKGQWLRRGWRKRGYAKKKVNAGQKPPLFRC